MNVNNIKCNHCGAECWAAEQPGICWGEMGVCDDFGDGNYTHYCDGHGHYEDKKPYRAEPQGIKNPSPS